jgi:Cu/Ag efflux pump CusA
MDKKLKSLPEVERVFGKIGTRRTTSTDPAPLTMIETTVLLQPKSKWRKGMTKEKLVAEMDRAVETIGYVNAWVQPIRARVMMQTTGIQTPVGVKVSGPDIATIEQLSQQIEGVLRTGSWHEVGDRRTDLRGLLRRRSQRSGTHGRARRHAGRGDGHGEIRAGRR